MAKILLVESWGLVKNPEPTEEVKYTYVHVEGGGGAEWASISL